MSTMTLLSGKTKDEISLNVYNDFIVWENKGPLPELGKRDLKIYCRDQIN